MRPAPLLSRTLYVFLWLGVAGCASAQQAYLDWRPGLSAMDFDGTFEIGLDEYDGFADEGEPNTIFDRARGIAKAEAGTIMAKVGDRVTAGPVDARGYAILSLGGDGKVALQDDGDRVVEGNVDWFAASPDGEWVALTTGTMLAVAIGEASAGVELGSLLGGGAAGHQLMLLVEEDELTVFVLPQIGGVVAANEGGYILSFRHRAGAREPWDISVARVSITM